MIDQAVFEMTSMLDKGSYSCVVCAQRQYSFDQIAK
jgi:hypothetical protein